MYVAVIKNECGFTLLELVVAMFIAMLITMGAATTFIVQNKVASIQEGTSDMQLSGQVVLDLLERDIRMAGYGVDKTTCLNALGQALTGDPARVEKTGAVFVNYSTTSASRYTYFIEDKSKVPARAGGLTRRDEKTGLTETIASNVEDMQVQSLLDANGVRTVTLSLLVKSSTKDPNYTQTPPSIGGITPAADFYRRRVFTSTVRPRNIGM
jgi:type II secretory pathway pseudopilin PulG